jgi:hypothetical protein
MQFARGSFSEKIVYLGNEDEYDYKYNKIIVSVRPSFIFFISSSWAFETRVGFFRNEFYRNLSAGGYKLNTFSIDILNIGVGLTYFHPKNFIRQVRALFLNFVKARNHRACGERGIRTLGPRTANNGFRDRPIRPLWHLSDGRLVFTLKPVRR